MDSLLFLSHRLPFPPTKGDKVRSYHFLRHLAKNHRIFLGTFIDDPADWEYVESVRSLCADVHVEAIHPRIRKLASASAFLTGEALTLPYFRSRRMQAWVRRSVSSADIAQGFAFSSPMAQYLLDVPGIRAVADFVDMDSAKWREFAQRHSWPVSAIYRREARLLLEFERRVAAAVDSVLFVTQEETRLFRQAVPAADCALATIGNGVDAEYFAAHPDRRSPFDADEAAIVFTGAMDYWPNADAVTWFAAEVLPEIRKREPRARFHIVGMNPSPAVRSLSSDSSIVVTGRVDDVRPYLQHARVVVAPLRVARGIQNKVLEAMAMGRPVVVTPSIASSLSGRPGIDYETASEPKAFANAVVDLLDVRRAGDMGKSARLRILGDYGWAAPLRQLDALLAAETAPAFRTVPPIDVPYPLAAE